MNSDGTNQTRLTDSPASDFATSWSPDGTRIAFWSDRDGNLDIYVMNSNGTNQTRLTNHPALDAAPSWSQSGTKITFTSNRDGNPDIYVMNSDGTNPSRLTNHPATDDGSSWSPDGKRIAFTSNRDRNFEIYVMNTDGSNQTRLTNNLAMDSVPRWSPDSQKITFTSFRDGNSEIYVMNADGTNQTRLTNHPAIDEAGWWSPDGTEIVFDSYRDGNPEIYIMRADGSHQTRITNHFAADAAPLWAPQESIPHPLIRLSQDEGSPGVNITLFGLAFPPSTKVTGLTLGSELLSIDSFVTDHDGTVSLVFVVPQSAPQGSNELRLDVGGVTGIVDFLVTTSTPTPAPRIGVITPGKSWEVTILETRLASQLSGYTPDIGNTFLVVVANFRNLDPTKKTELMLEEVAIIDEGGRILTAVGAAGLFQPFCINCKVTTSSGGDLITHQFAFVIPDDAIEKVFKFQFREVPPIPFPIGQSVLPPKPS